MDDIISFDLWSQWYYTFHSIYCFCIKINNISTYQMLFRALKSLDIIQNRSSYFWAKKLSWSPIDPNTYLSFSENLGLDRKAVALESSFENLGLGRFDRILISLNTFCSGVAKQQNKALGIELQTSLAYCHQQVMFQEICQGAIWRFKGEQWWMWPSNIVLFVKLISSFFLMSFNL